MRDNLVEIAGNKKSLGRYIRSVLQGEILKSKISISPDVPEDTRPDVSPSGRPRRVILNHGQEEG